MKEQYKDLKLIIECPTRETRQKVTDFFGFEWTEKEWGAFNEYGLNACVRICAEGHREPYGFGTRDLYNTVSYKKIVEYISYPEFENRFLKPMENKTIDLSGLSEQHQKIMLELEEMFRRTDKPVEPEKWTVERVLKTVKAEHFVDQNGNLSSTQYYKGEINNVPTSQDAQKVVAFCQLLTCAHWANENSLMEPEHEGYGWKWTRRDLYLPLYFRNLNAYDRFMSIEGIEPLLKTLFGITD